ncbi:alkaline phosphatase family protein [Candidatus Acetothermia bacterium]|nr:alkaline phosphatase family protein [Candidatus Acetothermia bacterium]MCI2431835.1 alkaline phosphatase family protein [Candidatus Acetothermia bacterium]MCI2435762.1 alkaline phosphatase family protein [Candidatus Acetothermia bacterium]
MPRKLFILSLDGTPYTLLQQACRQAKMPYLQRLLGEGSFVQLDSVIPTISSVAWATFATGVNPAKHSIFGFVDVDRQKQFYVPNASHLRAKTLWQHFDDLGLRSIWINLPIAYPPAPINGVMISGFLGTRLENCVHPDSLLPILQRLNYLIDPDPVRAHSDPEGFMKELFAALQARRALTLQLLQSEPWDFFMLHIMETDRLHHFFWNAKDDLHSPYHRDFWEIYKEIDMFIGELLAQLPYDTELLMLSDHGFCAIRYEVELNAFLKKHGLLRFRNGSAQDLSDLDAQTRAFGLVPGRLYLRDLHDREAIEQLLYQLCDPQTQASVCGRVYSRDELYVGPYLAHAADLFAIPRRGYDLKARLNATEVFTRTALQGMHTLDDAFLFVRRHQLHATSKPGLLDLAPTICELLNVPSLPSYEGRSLLVQ